MDSTEDKSRDELPPGFSGRLKMYSMLIGSVRTPVANAHGLTPYRCCVALAHIPHAG